MTELIGPVILDLMGPELSLEERELLAHPHVGGIILFTRNYSTEKELMTLCREVRQIRKLPLLITVDHEGGRVQRFLKGFTRLPSMGQVGSVYDEAPQGGLALAEICGFLMAAELLAVGIDLSFAPVLDLNKGLNLSIGDRAFHRKPSNVIPLAKAFLRGMHTVGMAATGKHFPGHGAVSADSHKSIPIDERSLDEIAAEDMQTFSELITAGLDAIMPAHIIFPSIDENPVGFSPYWLQTILRKKHGFSGMIFSDDLNMRGASFAGNYISRAKKALDAGCNMILICNNREAAVNILDKLPQTYHVPVNPFKAMQGKFSILWEDLKKSRTWQEKQEQFIRLTNHFEAV